MMKRFICLIFCIGIVVCNAQDKGGLAAKVFIKETTTKSSSRDMQEKLKKEYPIMTQKGVDYVAVVATVAEGLDKEELQKRAINAGWVTYHGKQCTEYGICSTLARMVRAVLHDEKRIMPASMLLDGEYGEHDVFVGVPCVIGKNGVEEVVELPLTAEEKVLFHQCCDNVRKHIADSEKIEAAK